MFVNYKTGACTNKIETEWWHAKTAMPTYGVHKGMHYGYLAEFLWHRKFEGQDLFTTLISHLNEVHNVSDLDHPKV